jgi:hypothetical protein
LPVSFADVFLVDAVHTYDAVIHDTLRATKKFDSVDKKYFIYDDYGAFPDVKRAIDDLIDCGVIEIVQTIGHVVGDDFVRVLHESEGVICREV